MKSETSSVKSLSDSVEYRLSEPHGEGNESCKYINTGDMSTHSRDGNILFGYYGLHMNNLSYPLTQTGVLLNLGSIRFIFSRFF